MQHPEDPQELSKIFDEALKNIPGRANIIKILLSIEAENGALPGAVSKYIMQAMHVDKNNMPQPQLKKEEAIASIEGHYEMQPDLGGPQFWPIVMELLKQIAEYDGAAEKKVGYDDDRHFRPYIHQ